MQMHIVCCAALHVCEKRVRRALHMKMFYINCRLLYTTLNKRDALSVDLS